MKRLLLLFCLILCSCEHSNSQPDCCFQPIDISKWELSFNSQEGIDSVFVLDDTYWWFWDRQKVLEFKGCKFIEHEKIECSWFSTVKKDDSTIIVSVKQNDTDQERMQNIYIKDNSYTGSFTIIQCPLPIELSKEELLFSAEGGIDSVTVTNKKGPWFTIILRGSDIGIISESIIFKPPYIKKGSWFTINILDEKKIVFSTDKNETGKEREFIATIGGDACGSGIIKVSQSAE